VRPTSLPLASTLPIPAEETDEGPELTTTLTAVEVELLRSALQTLASTATRHEHLYGQVHRLLQKLPTPGAQTADAKEAAGVVR
jgi:hypothetical protein